MRRIFLLLVSAAFLIGVTTGCGSHQPRESTFTPLPPASQPASAVATDYRFQSGDVIELKFFYHPELNEQLTIRPDGRISLQLVDEVEVAGRTPAQLRETLTQLYAAHVKNPKVAVILRGANDRKVYVGGEVKTPGAMALDGDLTALQAIVQAGGLTATAMTENVVVLRNQGTPEPLYITIDLKSDLELPSQRHDIQLMPRDIVFVPKTTIGKMNDFVDQYIDKLIPVSRSIGVFYDLNGNKNQ